MAANYSHVLNPIRSDRLPSLIEWRGWNEAVTIGVYHFLAFLLVNAGDLHHEVLQRVLRLLVIWPDSERTVVTSVEIHTRDSREVLTAHP